MKYFGTIVGITTVLALSSVQAVESSVANKINSSIMELESLPPPNTDEEIALRISQLGARLTQTESDPQRLMAGLTEYMTTSEGAPHLVMMLWPSIATPQERAQFLDDKIRQTPQSQIGFVAALVERELVDQQAVAKHPEASDAIGLGREVLYSGVAFIPIIQASGGVNPRLAAIWFSKSPYQAALAFLGDNDEEARLQLRRVNDLRFEMEEGKSNDQKEQAWRKLEHELELMLSSGSHALELYAAGVLKWKRTAHSSLIESDSLTSALNTHSDPLIDCILQGLNNVTLASLPSDKPILLSATSPIEQTAHAPPMATQVQQPKSAAEIQSSRDFPIVPVAIVVGAVIAGIAVYIFRCRSS